MADPSGVGGRDREAQQMKGVDDAVNGGPPHPAATPTNPTNMRPPPSPSSFAPSGDKGPRVYGSPIEGNAPSQ